MDTVQLVRTCRQTDETPTGLSMTLLFFYAPCLEMTLDIIILSSASAPNTTTIAVTMGCSHSHSAVLGGEAKRSESIDDDNGTITMDNGNESSIRIYA
jgi:hypothetical protein